MFLVGSSYLRVGHFLPPVVRPVERHYEEGVERGDQHQRQQREDDGVEPINGRPVGLVLDQFRGGRVYPELELATPELFRVVGLAASIIAVCVFQRHNFFFVCTVTTFISMFACRQSIEQRMILNVGQDHTGDLDDGKLVLRGIVLDLLEKLVRGGGVYVQIVTVDG